MKNLFVRFVREESGQDLIEYSLLAGIITIGSITLIQSIGGNVTTLFGKVDSAVAAAAK
jgi:pilus assembly protein Flp/PilA